MSVSRLYLRLPLHLTKNKSFYPPITGIKDFILYGLLTLTKKNHLLFKSKISTTNSNRIRSTRRHYFMVSDPLNTSCLCIKIVKTSDPSGPSSTVVQTTDHFQVKDESSTVELTTLEVSPPYDKMYHLPSSRLLLERDGLGKIFSWIRVSTPVSANIELVEGMWCGGL